MHSASFESAQLDDAWVEGEETARWRSGPGHTPDDGASASGSNLLEVEPGCRLPRHTDSAEETIVVVSGAAEVEVAGETAEVASGGLALVPADAPHEVRNVGQATLRFVALYAGTDVVTTYETEIQPGGERERRPLD